MAVEFGKRGGGKGQGGAPVPAGHGHGAAPNGAPLSAMSAQDWLRIGAQIAAAALIGFGLILWVAAHWDEISRFTRFAIVGGTLAAALVLSLANAVRTPALIVSFLATGGLLALIGQTYQTGADPWQLFAIWAAIGIPWALAARNDALWLLCAVVGMVAIALWLATHSGFGAGSQQRSAVIVAWLMAAAITVPLSPFAGLSGWLGQTRWAFRVAALVLIVLITQSGVTDLFTTAKGTPALYWLALVALGGMAGALVSAAAIDIVLVSVLGLSIDTLLITGFGRLVFESGAVNFASVLLIGLAGAGLVAGTGALILKIMRERAGGGIDLDALKGSEWPVILMTGIGALLTTIPLGSGLGLLFGPFLTSGIGTYVIGAALLAGAVSTIRSHAQTTFLHQLAAIGLTLGFCLVAFGLFRDTHGAIAPASAMLSLLALAVATFVGTSWTAALLGAAAGLFAALFLNQVFTLEFDAVSIARLAASRGWMLVLAAGAAWLVWRGQGAALRGDQIRGIALDSEPRIVGGAMVACLLGAMATAGPTFLLSGAIGIDGFASNRLLTGAIELTWQSLSPLSALLAAAGCALLLLPRPLYQTPLGIGSALVVIALCAVIPSLGGPILLLCAAISSRNRVLAIGASVAALWIIGSFYYWLGWPLTAKAALMLAAGLALAVLCVVTGLRRPDFGVSTEADARSAAPPLLARGLIVAGAVAIAGLATQSVTTNEAIIASGRQIFLALAPVDPRSLIQGDYMRLNFAVPPHVRPSERKRDASGRRWAVASIDDRHVATIERITDAMPASVGPDQIVLPMRRNQRRWIVGTDAWFFREGTAAKWQAARFGIFRVGANGTALLVGMADQDLGKIE